MIKGGLVSITFRQLSALEVAELVKKSGLTGIEWGGDIHVPHGNASTAKEVKKITDDAGLEVAAYGSYYRAGVSEAEGLSFESVLDSAIALKAPFIRIWAGNSASANLDDNERATIIDDILRITDMASRQGISICYEYHCHTLTDTNESAIRLLSDTKVDNIFTCWQPPNNQSFEYCADGLKAVLSRVCNVHVFNWIYPESEQIRTPLDDGNERWSRYLDILKSSGREHYAMIEFVKGNDPLQYLADAEYLKTIIC